MSCSKTQHSDAGEEVVVTSRSSSLEYTMSVHAVHAGVEKKCV